MNIIYIHSHDTGRYVQPYGHSIPTPNIQKLAEEGVLFGKLFAPTLLAHLAGLACCLASGLIRLVWAALSIVVGVCQPQKI